MTRFPLTALFCLFLLSLARTPSAFAQADDAIVQDVLKKLNGSEQVRGTEDIKSYKTLFDAYLELSKPPFELSSEFNLNTIHPKMSQWMTVSGWAESNPKMAEAIRKCRDRAIFGLPYGKEGLSEAYINAGLMCDMAINGSLRNNNFAYLRAIDTIAAFVTAEVYRLMESNQPQQALDLAVAHLFVVRQVCDRNFLAEKLHAIDLLNRSLSNLRDVMYTYMDKISVEQFSSLALTEIPFLRPDRQRLFLPEADRVIAEALIKEVFNLPPASTANPEKFTETFAEIQAREAPLTRFGAAKRWQYIALIHGSREASLDRLKVIYDDWWRRWRVDAYDQILNIKPEFDRTNRIRYAAVLYSIENVAVLFQVRNRLIAEVNGTAMAAGLCAFKRDTGNYPDFLDATYGSRTRKRSDSDPFHKELAPFKFRIVPETRSLNTEAGSVRLEAGTPLMWSQGQDLEDQRAVTHTDDGITGDMVIWPPIKSLQRAAGVIP